jgi:hypothetical protein
MRVGFRDEVVNTRGIVVEKIELGPPPRTGVQRRRLGLSEIISPRQKYYQRKVAVFTKSPSLHFKISANMSMITATTWVPRGFAAPFPERYVFDEDEYERIAHLAKLQLEDAKEELEEAQNEKKDMNDSTSGNVTKEKITE